MLAYLGALPSDLAEEPAPRWKQVATSVPTLVLVGLVVGLSERVRDLGTWMVVGISYLAVSLALSRLIDGPWRVRQHRRWRVYVAGPLVILGGGCVVGSFLFGLSHLFR